MHPKPEWSAETDPLHTRTPLTPEQIAQQLADARQAQRSPHARRHARAKRKQQQRSRRANRRLC